MSTRDEKYRSINLNPPKKLPRDESFISLWEFYVYQTPCPGTSAASRPLSSYGWKNGVLGDKKLMIRDYLLSVAGLKTGKTFFTKKNQESLNEEYKRQKRLFTKNQTSNAILMEKGKGSLILDVLFYIRCAFAHGLFERKKNGQDFVYRFVSIHKKGVCCYMNLKEETLLFWREVLIGGPKKFEERLEALFAEIDQELQKYDPPKKGKKHALAENLSYPNQLIFKRMKIVYGK